MTHVVLVKMFLKIIVTIIKYDIMKISFTTLLKYFDKLSLPYHILCLYENNFIRVHSIHLTFRTKKKNIYYIIKVLATTFQGHKT